MASIQQIPSIPIMTKNPSFAKENLSQEALTIFQKGIFQRF